MAAAGMLLALLVLGALANRVPAAEPERPGVPGSQPIIEGRRIFEDKGCAQCHSVWGTEDEQRMGPDLGGKAASWHDVLRFANAMWNHSPEMTESMRTLRSERSTLSPDEMAKVTAYLFYVKFIGAGGDVARGADLFEQRLCGRCHQLAGRGGTVGPRLDELREHMSSYFLARALWNHGPEMADKMAALGLVRPRLEGTEVADIVAFVRGGSQTAGALELAYSQAGIPRAGEELFRAKGCIQCHAVAGMGGGMGPDLSAQRPGLEVAEIAAAFWNHGAPMWAKMKEIGLSLPRFADAEMSDLLAYLAFVQYVGSPGDAARGGDIFRKKQCATCHAAGDDGPSLGPDLAASEAIDSVLHWASAMWNHAPAMERKVAELGISWPRFEDDEMSDLLAFLRSRGKGNRGE